MPGDLTPPRFEEADGGRLARALGIDLAWSPRNPTAVALAEITNNAVRVTHVECVRTDAEIIAWAQMAEAPLTIAIDAPLAVPNATGMRDCERQLQTLFGRHHAGPYPANRQLLGRVNGGRPRGEALSEMLQTDRGAMPGLLPGRDAGTALIEVFPAPAMVRLFGLDRCYPYKKKRASLGRMPWRSWQLPRRTRGLDRASAPAERAACPRCRAGRRLQGHRGQG